MTVAAGADGEEADEAPLLSRGNRLHPVRGSLIAFGGFALALFFSMLPSSPRSGVPTVGFAAMVIVGGLLDLLGTFDDPIERVVETTSIEELIAPIAVLFGGLGITWAAVRCAVAGLTTTLAGHTLGPVQYGALLVPLGFVTAVAGAGLVLQRMGVLDRETPLHRRYGFWLFVVAAALYLPTLGSHSLIDPWETHYGEVSREILSRQDWISTWWAQEDWFWSKPVLDFWLQAIAMVVFGVRYEPGEMISGFSEGRTPFPEWAVRFPIFLLSAAATYLLYKAVAKVFGKRSGFVGAVVLLTTPMWFFLSHQTMTDMPFVSTLAGAMAFVILGLDEDTERLVRVHALRIGPITLRLSAYHIVIGAVLAVAVPQIVYLFSKNIAFNIDPRWGLRSPPIAIVADSFMSGSAGNCGLPGNSPCDQVFPSVRSLQPAVQALVYVQALALFLYLNWGERRAQRLYFIGAWFLVAISTMAKGPAGIVVPVACALLYVVATRRYLDLTRMEILSGILVLLTVALPWFLAMYVRHGQAFLDRLIFHDMYQRAFAHVHDTNSGDDVSFRFFVWQLGYGLFPWIALAPAALVYWLRRPEFEGTRLVTRHEITRQGVSILLVIWVLIGFALFSLIQTKFHHYIFPIVPAIAMLVGIYANEMLERIPPGMGLSFTEAHEKAATGVASFLGSMLVLLVGRDMAARRAGEPSDARLLDLFTYKYDREWPDTLDYSKHFWVAAIIPAVIVLAAGFSRLRRGATLALAIAACGFTAWCLDVYFMETSPHWGQREVIAAYYQEARQKPGPLISYQQNWKGENFYTGNHIAAFPSSGQAFKNYIADLRKKKLKTFYFLAVPGNVGRLGSELGFTEELATLTPMSLNNKFVLVRATID